MKTIASLLSVFILSLPTFGEEISINSYNSSNTIRFIENRGQYLDSTGEVARDVLYLADIPGGRLYVRRSGISLVSIEKKYAPSEDKDAAKDMLRPYPALLEASSARVDNEFLNTSPEIQFLQSEGSSEYLNYYLPHCKLTGVPVYESVLLKGVYMGIDLRVYQGPEMIDPIFKGIQNCSMGDFQCTTQVSPNANVYFFPAEYNSYGAGASVCKKYINYYF